MKEDKNALRTPQIIAGAVTVVAALALLLFLWYTQVGPDREELAAASVPEESVAEEIYIEPEMLVPEPAQDAEEEADQPEEAAAEALGLPEKTPEPPKEKQVNAVHSEQPKPTNSNRNLTTQQKPSPVKTQPATTNPKPDSRIANQMGAQFNANNGSPSGRHGSAGSGGSGTSVSSKGITGRTFHGYKGSVKSDKAFRATVSVRVTVTASGAVAQASLVSAGGAPQSIAQQCVAWARRCSWSAKPGAADAQGVIYYNIVVNP